jgi:hypothetical protein
LQRVRTSLAPRVQENISERARKKALTILCVFITQPPHKRVTNFSTHSQKISATRYCGLKGGIIDGD